MSTQILYLIMRNDLPSLNPGKLAAQAAHVANAAVKRGPRSIVHTWGRQTPQAFGTTIVLGAPLDFIRKVMGGTIVWDPSYPCTIPYEVGAYLETTHPRLVHVDHTRSQAYFLRREVVGAWSWHRLAAFDKLELYP